jgi:uncharacterized protein YyaL (SSP411 family)
VKIKIPLLAFIAFFLSTMTSCAQNPSSDTTEKVDEEEHGHVRAPLPSAEEIAKLPKDGGEEFNRLIFEQSPYLQQHARNPIDWRPWGEEAFKKAAEEDKPVFLSIGYTTCHWCHVMEHESFEDEEVAKVINENYIAIKVDREERPDIDEVYMTVTQQLTGRGGWPMTVIMAPDKRPFFAGTYIPKDDQPGRRGLISMLTLVDGFWADDRGQLLAEATRITDFLQGMTAGEATEIPEAKVFDQAFQKLSRDYDTEHGGFGSAPKFPVPPNLSFLLRYHKRSGDAKALEMVEHTLRQMRKGGVYDHIGYGTHRYSTDRVWLLPHFEKMLYDQALLAIAHIETYQVTGDEFYADIAREIFTYVLRDMTAPEGGFYSAEDADSEGEEGTFYIWTPEQIVEVLGEEDGALFNATYDITEDGNFVEEANREITGKSIPRLTDKPAIEPAKLEAIRQKLFAHREGRIHPQKDDKILTDWNGLMIAALAKGAQALDSDEYRDASKKAADFVLKNHRTEDGRLLKRSRGGPAGLPAHLEDYAFMSWGLLDLYEATFEPQYLEAAISLTDVMIEHFRDDENGAFFMTANDAEELLVRSKKLYGGAIPAGNAVAALNLARLYHITLDGKNTKGYGKLMEEIFETFGNQIQTAPSAFPQVLLALDFYHGPSNEIVISGPADSEMVGKMLAAVRKPFLPNKVVILRPEGENPEITKLSPLTEYQIQQGGKPTAYICEKGACKAPTNEIAEMLKNLGIDSGAE